MNKSFFILFLIISIGSSKASFVEQYKALDAEEQGRVAELLVRRVSLLSDPKKVISERSGSKAKRAWHKFKNDNNVKEYSRKLISSINELDRIAALMFNEESSLSCLLMPNRLKRLFRLQLDLVRRQDEDSSQIAPEREVLRERVKFFLLFKTNSFLKELLLTTSIESFDDARSTFCRSEYRKMYLNLLEQVSRQSGKLKADYYARLGDDHISFFEAGELLQGRENEIAIAENKSNFMHSMFIMLPFIGLETVAVGAAFRLAQASKIAILKPVLPATVGGSLSAGLYVFEEAVLGMHGEDNKIQPFLSSLLGQLDDVLTAIEKEDHVSLFSSLLEFERQERQRHEQAYLWVDHFFNRLVIEGKAEERENSISLHPHVQKELFDLYRERLHSIETITDLLERRFVPDEIRSFLTTGPRTQLVSDEELNAELESYLNTVNN